MFMKLPRPFQFLTIFCAAVPIYALAFLPSPLMLFEGGEVTQAAALMAAYWLFPIALALGVLRTGQVSVPLYFGQCLALLFHTAVMRYEPFVTLAQLLCLVLMISLGVVFTQKDYLLPLVWTQARGFRRAKRHYRQAPLTLVNPKTLEAVDVIMENFSMTGLRVVGNNSLDRFVATLPDDKAQLIFRDLSSDREKVVDLAVDIVWHRNLGPVSYCGMATAESDMFTLIACVAAAKRAVNVYDHLGQLWQRRWTRRAVLAIWTAAMIVAAAIPACSRGGGFSVLHEAEMNDEDCLP